jgi:hypothetical protein
MFLSKLLYNGLDVVPFVYDHVVHLALGDEHFHLKDDGSTVLSIFLIKHVVGPIEVSRGR